MHVITYFPGGSPRLAGMFLLLAALANVAMVYARLAADADQATLRLTLQAIDDNTLAYAGSAMARIASGAFLFVAAGVLRGVLSPYHPLAARVATAALSISGLVTLVSGVCAIVLTTFGPAAIAFDGTQLLGWAGWLEIAREITGKVGFTLAGVGLIALGPVQWRAGGLLKGSAVADVIIGVVMLFIWVDAATMMHRISGIAFLVWLVISGLWLVAGLLKPPAPAIEQDGPQNATGEYEYGRPRY